MFGQSFPIRRLQKLVGQAPDHGAELLGLQAMVGFKCERVLAVNGLVYLWVGLKGQRNYFSTLKKVRSLRDYWKDAHVVGNMNE